MAISLPLGTKEYLVVIITDRLGNLSDLDDLDDPVTYYVVDKQTNERVIEDEADNEGMTALCVIDTEDLTEGSYQLFVSLNNPPQRPVLGPFDFQVEDYENDEPPIVT